MGALVLFVFFESTNGDDCMTTIPNPQTLPPGRPAPRTRPLDRPSPHPERPLVATRVTADGVHLACGSTPFPGRGVTYGSFLPPPQGGPLAGVGAVPGRPHGHRRVGPQHRAHLRRAATGDAGARRRGGPQDHRRPPVRRLEDAPPSGAAGTAPGARCAPARGGCRALALRRPSRSTGHRGRQWGAGATLERGI